MRFRKMKLPGRIDEVNDEWCNAQYKHENHLVETEKETETNQYNQYLKQINKWSHYV